MDFTSIVPMAGDQRFLYANYAQPGPLNTFVPTFAGAEAEDGLVIGFSRNIKDFAVNNYSQIVPVSVSAGKYLALATQQFIRFPQSGGQANQWPDGADRPTGQWNTVPFSFVPYTTQRRDYAFLLGEKTVEQAQFGIQQIHIQEVGEQCMIDRTQSAVQALVNGAWGSNAAYVDPASGNYPVTATPPLLTGFPSGSNWGNGTPTAPFIQISIQTAALAILKATQGTVTLDKLKLLIGPDTAYRMSQSPEIKTAFIQSQFAKDSLTGTGEVAAYWGLPPRIAGVEIVVEQSYVDTSNLNTTLSGASDTVTTIVPTGDAFLVSRPGGLIGVEGARNWSTLVMFAYEEMTTEVFNDPQNRRVQGHVTSDFVHVLTSPSVGYFFSKVFSV